jgi:anti-sigma factor (TIGR02949 family)
VTGHDESTAGVRSVLECSEALLRVFEFLDGEMAEADHAAIRAHLDACAECLRQYDVDQMVKLVVKRSCRPEPAPVHLRATIVQRLTVIRVETAD